MIKILILDDFDKKINKIKQVLLEGCGLQEEDIVVAKSVAGGRDAITKDYYDLVLLDLVLPLYDGEDPEEKGGLSFIRDINSSGGRVNVPSQIIGLTEKGDAYEAEKAEFQSLCFNVIQCKQGDIEWINKLKYVVNYSIRCKESIEGRLLVRNKYDIGVICALPEEFSQMISAFGGKEKWQNVQVEEDVPYQFKSIVVTTAKNHDIKVVAAMAGRPGVVPTSVLTTIMYILFHVDTVFMTGFSAGLPSSSLKLGDILVASSIQDYALGKLKDEDGCVQLMKEIHQVDAPSMLALPMQELIQDADTKEFIMGKIRQANLLCDKRDSYMIHWSATCCGPYVVSSESFVSDLKQNNRKLEGLDMEGFGLYLTSKLLSGRNQKNALWMKGIGDFADPNKADGYHKTCSYGSAVLLYRFIKEKL